MYTYSRQYLDPCPFSARHLPQQRKFLLPSQLTIWRDYMYSYILIYMHTLEKLCTYAFFQRATCYSTWKFSKPHPLLNRLYKMTMYTYSPIPKRRDPKWSLEYKSKSRMILTGFFLNGTGFFLKKPALCPFRILFWIPMTISGPHVRDRAVYILLNKCLQQISFCAGVRGA